LLEIQKIRTSPWNPKGNGLVERFNKTLVQMIKSFIKDDRTEWDLHISYLTAAYRASVQESTGMAPNFVMLGSEVRLPVDLIYKEAYDQYRMLENTQKIYVKTG
jgi:hypothetical protein